MLIPPTRYSLKNAIYATVADLFLDFLHRFSYSAKLNGCNIRNFLLCRRNLGRRSLFSSLCVTKCLPRSLARIHYCLWKLLLFTLNRNGYHGNRSIRGSFQPIIPTIMYTSHLKTLFVVCRQARLCDLMWTYYILHSKELAIKTSVQWPSRILLEVLHIKELNQVSDCSPQEHVLSQAHFNVPVHRTQNRKAWQQKRVMSVAHFR